MRRSIAALWTGLSFAAALSGTGAQAADMSRSWPLPEIDREPVLTATEFVSGWYLRGDLGYRYNRIGSIEGPAAITDTRMDNVFAVGGGVGYKYDWLRADATLDYGLRARAHGDAGSVSSVYSAKIDAVTALANVYLDLGNWAGFTPYIGAGAGASRLNVTEFRNGTAAAFPPTDTWRFSWAWMAGASYQFMPNLALDVGYRHLKLGDAVSASDSTGRATTFKNIWAQEIRVGFRLLID